MTIQTITYHNLVKFLNFRRDKERILFSLDKVGEQRRLKIDFLQRPSSQEERFRNMVLFKEFLKSHVSNSVIQELDLLEFEDLTVGRIREIYCRSEKEHLDGLHKVVAEKPLYRSVPLLMSVSDYIIAMVKHFGFTKFTKVAEHFDIDFEKLLEKGKPLTADIVHQMTLGFYDIRLEDVVDFAKRLTLAIEQENLEHLPTRELEGLLRVYKAKNEEELLEKLKVESIDDRQFNHLIQALMPEHPSSIFSGHRIEGPINSSKAYLSHELFRCKWFDDKERLQLYQDILDLPNRVPEDQIEKAYDEIFAKALVKKELQEGMLIPAPPLKGEIHWYVVEKRVWAGKGKVFYHLVPVCDEDDIKERLEYRSTASSPAMIDSVNTVIADLHPASAPGYYCKTQQKDLEATIITSGKRPLKINGHSLGGALSQLALINAIESGLPFNRPAIEINIFDSPAIAAFDTDKFAKWAVTHPEIAKCISITGHFSARDFVAGSGEKHLGYGLDAEYLKEKSTHLLDAYAKAQKWIPSLNINPHTQEFYTTLEGVDFTNEAITIEKYDDAPWRQRVEKLRRRTGRIIAPILRGLAGIKTYLIGSRLQKSGISETVEKIKELNLLPVDSSEI